MTKKNGIWMKGFLMTAVLVSGCLFEAVGGCLGAWQRELDVLVSPEASMYQFRDSYLADHEWGRQLIKWWNYPN